MKDNKLGLEITISETFNPKDFFKHREGLFVYSQFVSNVLTMTSPIEPTVTFNISSSETTDRLTEREIEAALPTPHYFTPSRVCAVIAKLIALQPAGEKDKGHLAVDGYVNFFFTETATIGVIWNEGKWYVRAWSSIVQKWDKGHRVFYPIV